MTVTTYNGSDALTDTLLKVSRTESEPSGLSATTFTLNRVLVTSPACAVAPMARRFPHAPGLLAVKVKPLVVLLGVKIFTDAAAAPGTLTPLPSVPPVSIYVPVAGGAVGEPL